MYIRKIRKKDYKSVDALLLQLHRIDVACRPEMFSPISQYMPAEAFESLIRNENVIALLVQEKDSILACCFTSILRSSKPTAGTTAYIDLLVVDEQHRRQGIGRMLFQEVRRRAGKAGATRLDLMVWSHNPIAQHAYHSYGMVPQRCVYELSLTQT